MNMRTHSVSEISAQGFVILMLICGLFAEGCGYSPILNPSPHPEGVQAEAAENLSQHESTQKSTIQEGSGEIRRCDREFKKIGYCAQIDWDSPPLKTNVNYPLTLHFFKTDEHGWNLPYNVNVEVEGKTCCGTFLSVTPIAGQSPATGIFQFENVNFLDKSGENRWFLHVKILRDTDSVDQIQIPYQDLEP